MLFCLFIVIMSIGRKYLDIYFVFKNTIYQPVFLCNLPTPTLFRFSF